MLSIQDEFFVLQNLLKWVKYSGQWGVAFTFHVVQKSKRKLWIITTKKKTSWTIIIRLSGLLWYFVVSDYWWWQSTTLKTSEGLYNHNSVSDGLNLGWVNQLVATTYMWSKINSFIWWLYKSAQSHVVLRWYMFCGISVDNLIHQITKKHYLKWSLGHRWPLYIRQVHLALKQLLFQQLMSCLSFMNS